jgi:hypothetical protein
MTKLAMLILVVGPDREFLLGGKFMMKVEWVVIIGKVFCFYFY